MSSLRRRVLLFAITNFLQIGLYLVAMVNYPEFLTRTCGFSEKCSGMLVGLLAVSTLLSLFPLGLLSDRVSPKKLYMGSQVLIGGFFLLLTVVRSLWLMWPVFILGGVGFAGTRVLLPTLYYKFLPEKERARNVSIFLGIGFLGFGIGGLAGGYSQGFSAVAGFYAAAGSALFLFLWAGLLPDSAPEKIGLAQYKGDLLRPQVLAVILVFFLMGLHFGVEQYGFPKLVRDGLGISSRTMGWIYFGIGMVLGGVTLLIMNFFAKHSKHLYYFGIALIISGLFQAVTFLAAGPGSLLGIRLGHVLGDAMIITMQGIVVAAIFTGARMGGNVGFVNLVSALGQFAGTFFAGLAIDMAVLPAAGAWGRYTAAFTVSGIIMILAGLPFIVFRRSMGIAEDQAPADPDL